MSIRSITYTQHMSAQNRQELECLDASNIPSQNMQGHRNQIKQAFGFSPDKALNSFSPKSLDIAIKGVTATLARETQAVKNIGTSVNEIERSFSRSTEEESSPEVVFRNSVSRTHKFVSAPCLSFKISAEANKEDLIRWLGTRPHLRMIVALLDTKKLTCSDESTKNFVKGLKAALPHPQRILVNCCVEEAFHNQIKIRFPIFLNPQACVDLSPDVECLPELGHILLEGVPDREKRRLGNFLENLSRRLRIPQQHIVSTDWIYGCETSGWDRGNHPLLVHIKTKGSYCRYFYPLGLCLQAKEVEPMRGGILHGDIRNIPQYMSPLIIKETGPTLIVAKDLDTCDQLHQNFLARNCDALIARPGQTAWQAGIHIVLTTSATLFTSDALKQIEWERCVFDVDSMNSEELARASAIKAHKRWILTKDKLELADLKADRRIRPLNFPFLEKIVHMNFSKHLLAKDRIRSNLIRPFTADLL